MSSRALRRVQKEKEIEEIVDNDEDLVFEMKPKNKNIFQQVKIEIIKIFIFN